MYFIAIKNKSKYTAHQKKLIVKTFHKQVLINLAELTLIAKHV